MDRRQKTDDRRIRTDRRQQPTEVAEERRAQPERRKAARRRQIDPTTCERDYSNDELEFMRAMDEYKRANGRMFPTCSEILEVIRNLGYSRPPGFSCTNAPFGGTIVSGAVEETTV
jgi:AraC-like DNA-binding protein